MSGPLAGLKVLDLTTVLMGPFATQLLGDMGASVVKIEAPDGDLVRGLGPMRNPGMGAMFLHANRGKRSLVLDLKQKAGRAALLKVAEGADLLVYNIRPQAMARLGLAYADLAAVNPGIVYAGVFGYGQDGPYAARPAFDDLIQGAAAIPSLFAAASGGEPRYVPLTMADRTVGISAVGAILAALWHRERTGEGQAVDIPMFETLAQFVLGDHMSGRSFEPALGTTGYPRLLTKDRRPYQTKDGYVCALIYTDQHWRRFFEAVGEWTHLADDPRFATLASRLAHIDEIYPMVAALLRQRTTAEVIALFDRLDIPVTRLHTVDSLIDDPHLAAKGFFREVEHPSEGRLRQMAVPTQFSKTAAASERLAPRLGEHSREVLREAGYGDGEIDALVAGKVTIDAGRPPREED